jgi:diguanylate cyclase
VGQLKLAASVHQPFTNTLGRVLSLLERLKTTSSGAILYQHIERLFREFESSHLQTEQFYLALLDTLLANLEQNYEPGSPQSMELFILQKSLQYPLSENEIHNIREQIQQLLSKSQQLESPGAKTMQETMDSLSLLKETTPGQGGVIHPPHMQSAPSEAIPETITADTFDANLAVSDEDEMNFENGSFCYIDQARSNIQTIQASLTDQINNAKQFNAALAKLLHSSFATIRNLEASDNITQVKNNFLRRYAKLIKMQQDLATKFQSIDDSLHDIESNRQNLNDELTRVHRMSLTDELTQLPNRRAFLMRLDDEISRALRFNYPLTLAVIDIDNFKPINDTFGHAAGDLILRHLAQNMNIIFRYHDMAARYGGEEFAVLFPNTSINGALNALIKLQKKLKADPFILSSAEEIPVPTFSAGITLYNPGEDADELIRRADTAMYQAKASGRDHIEIDPLSIEKEKNLLDTNSGI